MYDQYHFVHHLFYSLLHHFIQTSYDPSKQLPCRLKYSNVSVEYLHKNKIHHTLPRQVHTRSTEYHTCRLLRTPKVHVPFQGPKIGLDQRVIEVTTSLLSTFLDLVKFRSLRTNLRNKRVHFVFIITVYRRIPDESSCK